MDRAKAFGATPDLSDEESGEIDLFAGYWGREAGVFVPLSEFGGVLPAMILAALTGTLQADGDQAPVKLMIGNSGRGWRPWSCPFTAVSNRSSA